MSLLEKIETDFITAFKAKKETEVSVLRMLKSALKNEQINKKAELTEADAEKVIKTELKKRNDSIAEYEKAGRTDLVDKEKVELKILEQYLPAQLSPAEIETKVDAILLALSDTDKANFGKVMGAVMKEIGNSADGNTVRQILQQKLAK